jgi:hypothetical protein
MSAIDSLLLGPPATTPKRRPGRPRRGSTWADRLKHINVLIDLTRRGWTLAQCAERRGISVSSVQRYRRAALSYDDSRVALIRKSLVRSETPCNGDGSRPVSDASCGRVCRGPQCL